MKNQEDWDEHLDSVLFSIRVHKHSSTGMTPFRMLYNRDPILPFQFKDRLEQDLNAKPTDCIEMGTNNRNSVEEMVFQLERGLDSMYAKAAKNIKKAQKVQERNYNKRHEVQVKNPIQANDLVMKVNLAQRNRKAKMKNAHLGPYCVVSVSDKGYILKDKYSHILKRPVPGIQLVRYFGHMPLPENVTSKSVSTDFDIENAEESIPEESPNIHISDNLTSGCEGDMSSESDIDLSTIQTSQRCLPRKYRLSLKRKHKYIEIPQKQLVIARGSDQCQSSDDSVVIDVCKQQTSSTVAPNDHGPHQDLGEKRTRSVLLEDIGPEEEIMDTLPTISFCANKEDFLIPFSETLQNEGDEINLQIIHSSPELDSKATTCKKNGTDTYAHSRLYREPTFITYFHPLNQQEIFDAGAKLGIRIERAHTRPKFTGIGLPFVGPPSVTVSAKADGQCLPNTLSLLLSGSELYAFLIRNAICNYIENPQNIKCLRQHIPIEYTTGRKYVLATGRRKESCWCTDVEIFAFTQITGYDVMVYTNTGKWLMYTKSSCGSRTTERAFYINNISGGHFDPVFTTKDYL